VASLAAFTSFSHCYGFNVKFWCSLTSVVCGSAAVHVGCGQCPQNVCEKFHPSSAKPVSAIIRLRACVIRPGGPLWLWRRFNKKTKTKHDYVVLQIFQVFLVILCRLKGLFPGGPSVDLQGHLRSSLTGPLCCHRFSFHYMLRSALKVNMLPFRAEKCKRNQNLVCCQIENSRLRNLLCSSA